MREFVCVVALVLLTTGCATPDFIVYCEDTQVVSPEATAECLSEPAVMDRSARLADLIVPATESLLVRVEFDENSLIRSICGERGPGSPHWRDRVRVAERRAEMMALPAGPACLANTRLHFNQLGVTRAEVDEIIGSCVRQSPTPGQMRMCVNQNQINRNEIWVYDSANRAPSIFVATPDAVGRRKAILECADRNAQIGQSTFDALIASAPLDARLVDCMQTQGWKLQE